MEDNDINYNTWRNKNIIDNFQELYIYGTSITPIVVLSNLTIIPALATTDLVKVGMTTIEPVREQWNTYSYIWY